MINLSEKTGLVLKMVITCIFSSTRGLQKKSQYVILFFQGTSSLCIMLVFALILLKDLDCVLVFTNLHKFE